MNPPPDVLAAEELRSPRLLHNGLLILNGNIFALTVGVKASGALTVATVTKAAGDLRNLAVRALPDQDR